MFRNNDARRMRAQERKQRVRKSPALTNRDRMVGVQERFLPDESIFVGLKFHGNTSWSPRGLVWQALFWSWSECRHVTDAFADATGWIQKTSGVTPLSAYQGFMGALTRWTAVFIPLLWALLQARMEEWGWRVLANRRAGSDRLRWFGEHGSSHPGQRECLLRTALRTGKDGSLSQEEIPRNATKEERTKPGTTSRAAGLAHLALAPGVAIAVELETRTVEFQ